jgi:iron complex outermembrane recepter protein
MLKSFMVKSSFVALFCSLSIAAFAVAETPRQIDVPAGDLIAALEAMAEQADIELAFQPDQLKGLRTKGVSGLLTPQDAIKKLLEGTHLKVRTDASSGAMMIAAPMPAAAPAEKTTSNHSSERVRLVQADRAQSAERDATSAPDPLSDQTSASSLEEIVVTAQKRKERLQEVPVPVSALDAGQLARNSQLQLRDYFSRVPGLNFTSGNRGEPFIAIRGITTTPFANPTVGITIDDVPFGPTSIRGGGLIAPDIDPSDLERIEVLRGPQGTLYGVSSLGGVIKFVTVDPSTDGFRAHLSTSLSNVHGGDDLGYGVRGAVNAPLSETFAIRASAFTRREPGFIDNRTLNARDVNEADASGGQLSGLWRPSETFSARLSALYQERNVDASGLVSRAPGLGDLQQLYPSGSGWLRSKVEAYSAALEARLGSADLTSISGYNVSKVTDSVDLSPFYVPFFNPPGSDAVPFTENYETRKLSQELRLTLPMGDRLEWLLGGFYTDEKSPYQANTLATVSTTGALVQQLDNEIVRSTYEEWALFADLTVRLTDRFDIQFGGRKSDIEQTLAEEFSGPLWGGVLARSGLKISDDPFTYLVTPRLRVSPDLMVYARFASGYRAGGINGDSAIGLAPPGWIPDKTKNYEVGLKGQFLDRMLTVDASVYHIDWDDIQVQSVSSAGIGFISNGGTARSRGLELSMSARPLTGLSLLATSTWTDAEVTQGFGPTSLFTANSGDRLPFTSRFSGSLSADQSFNIRGNVTGFIGASLSYVGERTGLFRPSTLARQNYPSYTQTDVRGGLEFGTWSANAYINNIGDERGTLGGGEGAINPLSFIYIQPRTIGLSLTKTF